MSSPSHAPKRPLDSGDADSVDLSSKPSKRRGTRPQPKSKAQDPSESTDEQALITDLQKQIAALQVRDTKRVAHIARLEADQVKTAKELAETIDDHDELVDEVDKLVDQNERFRDRERNHKELVGRLYLRLDGVIDDAWLKAWLQGVGYKVKKPAK